MKKISLLLLLITLLSAALLLTSCGECSHKDSDGDLVCDECDKTLPDPSLDGKICYTVTVTDAFGEPVPDVIVQIFDGETQLAVKITDSDGRAACSKEYPMTAGDEPFTVKLVSPKGEALTYDESSAVIADGSEEITVVLYDSTDGLMSESIYPYGSDDPVSAPILTNGGYRVELKAGENYFIFWAATRGLYELATTAEDDGNTVTMGYFGAPHFVQSSNIATDSDADEVFLSDGALFFKIRSFSAGENYQASSKYVFKIDAQSAGVAYLTVRCADTALPFSDAELPWEEYYLSTDPEAYAPDFTVGSVSELASVPLNDPSFVAVYNAEDGFYHAHTADGPVILVKLTTDSEYLASFKTIMETAPFRTMLYGEDGNLIAKKDYHSMMQKYIDAVDEELGVYPLTAPLKEALTVVGGAWGWYADGGVVASRVTGTLVADNAYLFACCYYEEQ